MVARRAPCRSLAGSFAHVGSEFLTIPHWAKECRVREYVGDMIEIASPAGESGETGRADGAALLARAAAEAIRQARLATAIHLYQRGRAIAGAEPTPGDRR